MSVECPYRYGTKLGDGEGWHPGLHGCAIKKSSPVCLLCRNVGKVTSLEAAAFRLSGWNGVRELRRAYV